MIFVDFFQKYTFFKNLCVFDVNILGHVLLLLIFCRDSCTMLRVLCGIPQSPMGQFPVMMTQKSPGQLPGAMNHYPMFIDY